MFELLEVKWGEPTYGTPSGTVTWSGDLGGDLILASGTSDADIDAALQSALTAWEGVAAVDFLEVDSGGDFSIGVAPYEGNIAGVASYGPNLAGLNSLVSGSITFNSNMVWDDYGDGGTDFYAVALHELGHILGLAHPDDPTQIMNATIFADDLGDGDIAGAQFIYGLDEGDVPVDAPPPEEAADGGGGGGGGGGAIALVLGLLAVIAGMFTGAGAGIVAMAAGHIPGFGRDDDDEPADNAPQAETELAEAHLAETLFFCDDASHDHGADGMVFHAVFVEDAMPLPMIDFTQERNPCGCCGLCEHIRGEDELEESLFL